MRVALGRGPGLCCSLWGGAQSEGSPPEAYGRDRVKAPRVPAQEVGDGLREEMGSLRREEGSGQVWA